MDCRMSLLVVLVLAGNCCGCLTTKSSTQTPAPPSVTQTPTDAQISKAKPGPLRQPKAETIVALGVLKEREADKAPEDAELQQRLRDQARRAFQEAIKTNPKCLAAHQGLARVYLAQGDEERALETYRKATAQFPKEPSLWIDLAMCHNRKKNWDSAIQSLNKALELDPENRLGIQTLGLTLARAGRVDESVACLQKITAAANAHYQVARMMHHLQRRDLCRQHLQLALQANPNFQPAQQLLSGLDQHAPTGEEQITLQ